MALKTCNFDVGTEGASVDATTTALEGDACTAPVIAGTGTGVYRAASAFRGAKGIRTNGATADTYILAWSQTGALTFTTRIGFTVDSANFPVTTAGTILQIRNSTAVVCTVVLSTAGKVQVQNRLGVSSGTNGGYIMNGDVALPNGKYWLLLQGTVDTGTTGTLSCQIVRDSDLVEIDSQTKATVDMLAANVTTARIGKISSSGSYQMDLDEFGFNTGTTTPLTIPPSNIAPTAYAGVDQSVEPWATVTLSGSGSSDPDGTVASYAWVQVSGTAVTLSGSGATRTFTTPAAASNAALVFGLTVTDDDGAASTQDTVTVTVLAATEYYLSAGGVWTPMRVVQL